MKECQQFGFDWLRTQAASDLLPEHFSDFQRLIKTLCFGSKFQFIIAEFNNAFYRDELIKRIDDLMGAEALRSAHLTLAPESIADLAALETQLLALAGEYQVIQVIGADAWFDDPRWQAFNLRREAIARGVPVRLIFWLTGAQIARLALMAPDFWAWRSGVFSFERPSAPLRNFPVAPDPLGFDNRSLTERSRRLAEIKEWLAAEPPLEDALRIPLVEEMADLLYWLDRWDEALAMWRNTLLPFYKKSQDALAVARVNGNIARALRFLGQGAEALSIQQTKVLPVFESFGNKIAAAKVKLDIAKILGGSGRAGEALALLQNDVLAVAKQLEDHHLVLGANFEIAMILMMLGELDESLRIMRQDVLAGAEQTGDRRLSTSANLMLAFMLLQQGQLEAALRILQEKVLPSLHDLGDLVESALATWFLAQIRTAQGQPLLALQVLENETLPLCKIIGNQGFSSSVGEFIDLLRRKNA